MGSKGKTWYIYIIFLIIIGTIGFSVFTHDHSLTNAQFESLPINEQFKKAPAGHYIHLQKKSDIIYRTTWSAKQIHDYLINQMNNTTIVNRNGTTDAKSNLGTSHLFNDNGVSNTENGPGILTLITFELNGNGNFNSNMRNNSFSQKSKYDYNWYFNSLSDAKKDTNVAKYVKKIIR